MEWLSIQVMLNHWLKKIYENIAEARHYLPEAQIEIISNGDFWEEN